MLTPESERAHAPNSELERWLEGYVMEGLLGSYFKGSSTCKVEYKVIEEDEDTTTLVVCLQSIYRNRGHILCINRTDGTLRSKKRVTVTQEELKKIFQDLNLGTPDQRGLFESDYELTTKWEDYVWIKDKKFRVDLVPHRQHLGLNSVIRHFNIEQDLTVVQDYPTNHRVLHLFKVQITDSPEGRSGEDIYEKSLVSLDDRIRLAKRLARTFQSFWDVKIDRKIGDMQISGDPPNVSTDIEQTADPNHNENASMPFFSVSDFLTDHMLLNISKKLETGEHCLGREWCSDTLKQLKADYEISPKVEEVPIVISPEMRLSFMTFTSDKPYDLQKINFTHADVDTSPFVWSFYRIKQNYLEKGLETVDSEKVLDAFWDEIPKWKKYFNSQATELFLDWFNIMLGIMKNNDLQRHREAWGPVIKEVEDMRKKHRALSQKRSPQQHPNNSQLEQNDVAA